MRKCEGGEMCTFDGDTAQQLELSWNSRKRIKIMGDRGY